GDCFDGRALIDRPSEAIEHAAQQRRTHSNLRIFRARKDGITGFQAIDFFERYRKNASVAETGDLRPDDFARPGMDLAKAADAGGRTLGFDDESGDIFDRTAPAKEVGLREVRQIRGKIDAFGGVHRKDRRSAKPR